MSIQAMAVRAYGPLSTLAAITLPVPEPGPNEVRVRVHASAVNPADFKVLQGRMKFLHARRFPLVVGYDFSGTVESAGRAVAGLEVGHQVFGFLPYGPFNRRGAFAEALIARADEVALKPTRVSHEQAAAIATPGATALQSLRDLGRLRAGQRVLVTGVSGGVGSLAVAVARRLGAWATAIGSGRGLPLARSLGAAQSIDRTAGDVYSAASGSFEVIFDAAAAFSWRRWRARLRPHGTFVTTLPSTRFVADRLASVFSHSRARLTTVKSHAADLAQLAAWLEAGLSVPIDHVVGVRDVAESLAALERGGVLGRIVVDVHAGFA